MLRQPVWLVDDLAFSRDLIAQHPWVTLISTTPGGLHVSHLPAVLDVDAATDCVTVLGHVARRDAELHELGRHDVTVVIQGPHGYISPAWFRDDGYVPTWDYTTVHASGRPELLDDHGAHPVLHRTVEHLEQRRDRPWLFDDAVTQAWDMIPHVTAFRLRFDRLVAKAKLGQQRTPDMTEQVLSGLASDDAWRNPALADAIRRHRPPVD